MASLIPGYNYDIFISYRQKDNRHDGWVSEFVENLKGELESTFKEEVSVYFDINQHDGLLETHDVNESLKEKLRCLVFIPIISRTYCDPKSFAWEHEFKAFVEMASDDRFGLKVKLQGGNVALRVLPVQIHDLKADDRSLVESVLGGFLRGVEFIYSEPGVNRPLKTDDDENSNMNKTKYRNQINKVTNTVNDIIAGLRNETAETGSTREENTSEFKMNTGRKKSVIVLPFENMSPDKENDYFCDGITEEIINALAKIKDLYVVARTSAFAFRGMRIDVRDIGRKLDVGFLLEGSVRKSGNQLRITAQLINVENGYHLWSERYDRELTDIFSIQDDISIQIANKLKITIEPQEEDMLARRYTDNIEAYNLYLKGRYHWNMLTEKGFLTGIDLFNQAILTDPDYALAYSGIADCYCRLAWYSHMSSLEAFPKAAEAVDKALSIDAELPEVHASLGFLSMCYEHNYTKAEQEMKRAIQLNPGSAEAHFNYSVLLAVTRRHAESIKEGETALALDPLTQMMLINLGMRYYYARQFDTALDYIKKTLKRDPDFEIAHFYLAYNYAEIKMYDKALSEIERVINHFGRSNPAFLATQGIILALSSQENEARKTEDELLKLSKQKYISPFWMAYLCFVLGEKDSGFEWLEKGFKTHDCLMIFLDADPALDPYRSDSRFHDMLKKMNLT